MMKRLLVVLIVLMPLCWLTAGCGEAKTAKGPTELPSKEQMDKMLEGQRQIEMAKQKQTPGQAK